MLLPSVLDVYHRAQDRDGVCGNGLPLMGFRTGSGSGAMPRARLRLLPWRGWEMDGSSWPQQNTLELSSSLIRIRFTRLKDSFVLHKAFSRFNKSFL